MSPGSFPFLHGGSSPRGGGGRSPATTKALLGLGWAAHPPPTPPILQAAAGVWGPQLALGGGGETGRTDTFPPLRRRALLGTLVAPLRETGDTRGSWAPWGGGRPPWGGDAPPPVPSPPVPCREGGEGEKGAAARRAGPRGVFPPPPGGSGRAHVPWKISCPAPPRGAERRAGPAAGRGGRRSPGEK